MQSALNERQPNREKDCNGDADDVVHGVVIAFFFSVHIGSHAAKRCPNNPCNK